MGPVEDLNHASILESLPARPPTPPREALSHEAGLLPQQLIAPQQLDINVQRLQTPPGVYSPTTSSKDSTARRKRVGFSAQAQYQDAPIYEDPPSRRQNPTPLSLPSSVSRPVKSILKPSVAPNGLVSTDGVSLDIDKPGQINIADMLESTLQQLAGADRESKIDAYTMLFRALKASSNLPDRIALHEKMGLFMQFIQRDLASKTLSGTVDNRLVVSAMKLLHTFLHFPGIASSIPNDFAVFFVDHCVRCFEDAQATKEVIRHLMQALFFQNFPPEVMNFDRMGRLVNALHNVENHMTGKTVIQGRILVYEKLVIQCPQQMAVHSDWLQDMFTDMLSSAVEIRTAATKFGLSAAFTLSKDKRLVARALEFLNLGLEDKKYVEHITERLEAMLQDKEESLAVPRIWSVISLLIPKLDQWDFFKSWCNIIQLSFNNPNMQTKREANLAWGRFVYRMFLDRRLDQRSVLKLVKVPLLSQVRRLALRDSILGAIRNIFYYALRPDANVKTLPEIWDFSVAPLLQRLIEHEQEDHANVAQAAAILTGLIDCKTRRVWNSDRIKNLALVKDDELPVIEPKWVRANSARIFQLVTPILEKCLLDISVHNSPAQNLWRALVESIACASSKDVKLHDDTAKFVAHSFTFLLNAWKKGLGPFAEQNHSPSQFLDSIREFVLILVQGLGLLPNPFLDKLLIRSKDECFDVYVASSHRTARNQAVKRPPLHQLFLFLASLPPSVLDDEAFTQFFSSVFAPFFGDKTSKTQADLAGELLRLLPSDAYCPYGPWAFCAEKISWSLEPSQHSPLTSSSQLGENLGPGLRELTKLLERGLRSTPNLPFQCWSSLSESLLSHVRNGVGDAGVAIAVVEPLAAAIKDLMSDEKIDVIPRTWMQAASQLIVASRHPRDKQAVDAARRRLWGTSVAGSRGSSFDPYDNFYGMTVSMLSKVYTNLKSYDQEIVVRLLDTIGAFFERGNSLLVLRAVATVQTGLIPWIQDQDHRITKTEFLGVAQAVCNLMTGCARGIATDSPQTQALWQRLCATLITTSALKSQLATFEPLLCAAFQSTHREVLQIAAEAWNQVFEDSDCIEYPETLRTVLVSLGSSVHVARPGLEIIEDEADMPGPAFTESQDDSNNLPVLSPTGPKAQPLPVSRRSVTPGSSRAAGTVQSGQVSTVSRRSTSKRRSTRPKARHEDSQLQFTAIESTPALVAQDSQVLTDHQREVRERQKTTADIFPEMRSSPTEKTKKARSTVAQQTDLPTTPLRAVTPEQDPGFHRDDCLASTPTPRRGQSLPMPDQEQDMTDPPSSPPEPRGYRLLAELKSQCNKTASLDDWQFSSSPVSGSPDLAQQTISASQPMDLDDVDEELHLDDAADADGNGQSAQIGQHGMSSHVEIEDTAVFEQAVEVDLPHVETEPTTNHQSPITPTGRNLRSRAAQITPRSDNEEFVDAPSSPLPPTPSQRVTRRSAASSVVRRSSRTSTASQSFDISASFENGLRNVGSARIEIPVRSSQSTSPSKREFKTYKDILPESPDQIGQEQEEQQAGEDQQAQENDGALSSIEVGGASAKASRRGRPRKNRRAAGRKSSQLSQDSPDVNDRGVPTALVISTSVVGPEDGSQDGYEDVSPGIGKWWRKRRRSVSSVHSSGSSKRARHSDLPAESIQEEIPDSQAAAATSQGKSTLHSRLGERGCQRLTTHAGHLGQITTIEEVSQDDSQAIPGEVQPLVEHHEASQELPSALDERLDGQAREAGLGLSSIEGHNEEADAAGQTDDEEAVHSQLAREEEQASAERESRLASRAVSPVRNDVEAHGGMQREQQPTPDNTVEEALVDTMAIDEEPQPADHETGSEPMRFDGLMAMLKGGLATLQSMNLTREQYNQAEDVLFEVKREMLEAERRGRG